MSTNQRPIATRKEWRDHRIRQIGPVCLVTRATLIVAAWQWLFILVIAFTATAETHGGESLEPFWLVLTYWRKIPTLDLFSVLAMMLMTLAVPLLIFVATLRATLFQARAVARLGNRLVAGARVLISIAARDEYATPGTGFDALWLALGLCAVTALIPCFFGLSLRDAANSLPAMLLPMLLGAVGVVVLVVMVRLLILVDRCDQKVLVITKSLIRLFPRIELLGINELGNEPECPVCSGERRPRPLFRRLKSSAKRRATTWLESAQKRSPAIAYLKRRGDVLVIVGVAFFPVLLLHLAGADAQQSATFLAYFLALMFAMAAAWLLWTFTIVPSPNSVVVLASISTFVAVGFTFDVRFLNWLVHVLSDVARSASFGFDDGAATVLICTVELVLVYCLWAYIARRRGVPTRWTAKDAALNSVLPLAGLVATMLRADWFVSAAFLVVGLMLADVQPASRRPR